MNKETISQIKARLQTITDTTDPYLQTIHDDSRKVFKRQFSNLSGGLHGRRKLKRRSITGSNTKSTIGKMDVSILQGWMK